VLGIGRIAARRSAGVTADVFTRARQTVFVSGSAALQTKPEHTISADLVCANRRSASVTARLVLPATLRASVVLQAKPSVSAQADMAIQARYAQAIDATALLRSARTASISARMVATQPGERVLRADASVMCAEQPSQSALGRMALMGRMGVQASASVVAISPARTATIYATLRVAGTGASFGVSERLVIVPNDVRLVSASPEV